MQSTIEERRTSLLEHLRWQAPEYWMLALSAFAWVTLAMRGEGHTHHFGVIANWQLPSNRGRSIKFARRPVKR